MNTKKIADALDPASKWLKKLMPAGNLNTGLFYQLVDISDGTEDLVFEDKKSGLRIVLSPPCDDGQGGGKLTWSGSASRPKSKRAYASQCYSAEEVLENILPRLWK